MGEWRTRNGKNVRHVESHTCAPYADLIALLSHYVRHARASGHKDGAASAGLSQTRRELQHQSCDCSWNFARSAASTITANVSCKSAARICARAWNGLL